MENEAPTSRRNVTFLQPGQERRQVGKTRFLSPKLESLFSVRLHRESTYKRYLPRSKGVSQASPGDRALPHLVSLAFSGVRGPGRTESPLLREAAGQQSPETCMWAPDPFPWSCGHRGLACPAQICRPPPPRVLLGRNHGWEAEHLHTSNGDAPSQRSTQRPGQRGRLTRSRTVGANAPRSAPGPPRTGVCAPNPGDGSRALAR